MKFYTMQEKQMIQNHPLFKKYSGNVPEELRHLVYPDEAKPADVIEKKGGKRKATEEQADDGDSN